ncbi:Sec-independent protein translocase protein TatB [Mesorhizobium sp.]|uniref:Sec-independent protein translocase protein TatB n=1 Tax=Mesorhizobium sp. TaxID=1871066 RepID=UPI000FE7E00A|nr:Sec-independent protein translocase protein TatB [Mesorhizobium sp.]RWB56190.1 MAG: twin-arginine translocase subunit TatB [Mesorhizobium sp.]TKB15967.1 MAG: twin-arginine translocase subunit TatB [Mesorhizobium sp.]
MFEVGWSELLVIAVVMIVVVGPKDLPNMLRTFGRTAAKLRAMAADFQKQFNDALKEAELDDVKSSVDSLRSLNPMTEIRKQLNPFEQAAADVRAGVDTMMKPKPAADVAAPDASPQAAEPLKNGATEMPGASGTEAAPAAPIFPAMSDASVTAPVAETATPAEPAKKAATSKTKAAGGAVKTVKASAATSAPAGAKAATPAKKVAPKAKAAPAAAKKPAGKKAADAKKTAGAAK